MEWDGDKKLTSVKAGVTSTRMYTTGHNCPVNRQIISAMPYEYAEIFVKCIRLNTLMGVYSDEFLITKITPIPKKGGKLRFLSVPCIYSSLEGKYVAACLNHYAEKMGYLHKRSFAFKCESNSTNTTVCVCVRVCVFLFLSQILKVPYWNRTGT